MIHLDNITEANRQQDFSVKPSQSGYAAGYWEILEKANAYRNARSSTLLIMNGDTPVGFCMYYDRDYFGAYQLSQITIDAAFQGRGFGREALALILQRLRQDGKFHKVRLGCIAGNEAALHLYQKFGFREIDREDDEIIMEAEL